MEWGYGYKTKTRPGAEEVPGYIQEMSGEREQDGVVTRSNARGSTCGYPEE